MVLIFLLLLSFSAFAAPCEGEDVLMQKFILTPFGPTEAWTIDAENVTTALKAIKDHASKNPKDKISKIELFSCASSVPMKVPLSTPKEEAEVAHVKLANERRQAFADAYKREKLRYPLSTGHGVCGPTYEPKDKDLRWKVKVEGEPKTIQNYEEAMNRVLSTPGIMDQFKEFALVETEVEIRKLDANPFMVKYRFFQGYRLSVCGKAFKKELVPGVAPAQSTSPSSKNQ